ncbi:ABC transporter ATP-binding protein [Ruegeria sp. EL01]|jgi:Cu-processing system ATP-binding protein|uniref:ABC transporter ATP-binding protein n=1 Tax=Ruegeria sp. EL01 TaxID=2107578 RepID=UPI000EA7FFC9|nr:ABC transporter ATP-binding protein [Ruegeria sp. EL01]
MTDKALTINHVSKTRGPLSVLDDITLSLAPGQRVALLGHNGAGKSTLIKSILGLTPIQDGAIQIGTARPGSAQARRDTAYLPEAVSFHPALTGREQLTLFAKLSGSKADVTGLLERVGLSDALDRRIGTYSKGMRQRLGLAQVLLGQPKVALLDEPTSGLDPISRQDLYAIIDELAAQGTAVLIASHALTEVEARTDRIAIMRKGRMVADDTLNNLSALAGLPIRLKVRASANPDALAAELGGSRINGASVELLCTPDDKMVALRRIAGLGDAVADVEMTPPKLEDLYRHYAQEERL